MKRIKAACLVKTMHFILKEDLEHDAAVIAVRRELEQYKSQLDRSGTLYRILSEETQPDGSIIIHIKMQYNHSPVGDYLN